MWLCIRRLCGVATSIYCLLKMMLKTCICVLIWDPFFKLLSLIVIPCTDSCNLEGFYLYVERILLYISKIKIKWLSSFVSLYAFSWFWQNLNRDTISYRVLFITHCLLSLVPKFYPSYTIVRQAHTNKCSVWLERIQWRIDWELRAQIFYNEVVENIWVAMSMEHYILKFMALTATSKD